jgi:HSP20 family molecular chaperone IbpA
MSFCWGLTTRVWRIQKEQNKWIKNTFLKKKGRGTMQKEHAKNEKQPDFIEPVTILRDEGKLIHIVTKLPGIPEEKIRIDIDLEKTTITIVAADTQKMYKKVITLPGNVVFSNKRFSDGELHLIVEKKES